MVGRRGRRMIVASALTGAATIVAGCADEFPPVAWYGPTTHFRLVGINEGVPIDAFSADPSMLTAGSFHCERTYEVPSVSGVPDESRARLVRASISVVTPRDGRLTRMSVEVYQEELTTTPIGVENPVIPQRDDVPPTGLEAVVELTLYDIALSEEFMRAAAKTGTVVIHALTGTPPPGSRVVPAGEGELGFTMDLLFNPEGLYRGSFSAPCTVNHIVVTP